MSPRGKGYIDRGAGAEVEEGTANGTEGGLIRAKRSLAKVLTECTDTHRTRMLWSELGAASKYQISPGRLRRRLKQPSITGASFPGGIA